MHVVGQREAGAPDAVRSATVRNRHVRGARAEDEGGRPSLRALEQRLGLVVGDGAAERRQQLAHFARGERQVGGTDGRDFAPGDQS